MLIFDKNVPDDLKPMTQYILDTIDIRCAEVASQIKEEIHQLLSRINLELVITLARECQQYVDKQALEYQATKRVKEAMDTASENDVLPLPTTNDTFNFQERTAGEEDKKTDVEYITDNSDYSFSMKSNSDKTGYSVVTTEDETANEFELVK